MPDPCLRQGSLPNNSVDTLPVVRDMIASGFACLIAPRMPHNTQLSADFPIVDAWRSSNWRIPERRWLLWRTDWSKMAGTITPT